MSPELPEAVFSVESYPAGRIKKHTKLRIDTETGQLVIDLGGIFLRVKKFGDRFGVYANGQSWTFYYTTLEAAIEAAMDKCRHDIKQARATIKRQEKALVRLKELRHVA